MAPTPRAPGAREAADVVRGRPLFVSKGANARRSLTRKGNGRVLIAHGYRAVGRGRSTALGLAKELLRVKRRLDPRIHTRSGAREGGTALRIENCMTPNPVTVTPGDSLAVAKARMDTGRFRRLPVVDQGKLVGILTEREIRSHLGYLESTRVNAAMTADPATITPRTTAEDAARLMLEHKIGGLPVLDNGALVGIVSTSDVLRAFLNVVQAAQEIMNE